MNRTRSPLFRHRVIGSLIRHSIFGFSHSSAGATQVDGPNACAKQKEAFDEPLGSERQALLCALPVRGTMQLFFKSLWPLLAFFLLAGCRTASPMPPVNVREPGWNVQQGQAVWRSRRNAPEIAGELVVAMHPDGRSLVQFTTTPLPFVVAQATIDSWQVQFVPQNKVYSGRGQPPARLIWLHLAQCLRGGDPPGNLLWRQLANQGWRLEDRSTGESLEGYLAP